MVRWRSYSSVLAIAAFAAGNVWAAFPLGAFEPDNYFNMNGIYPQHPNDTATLQRRHPYVPTDKQDGYVWLKTGSAKPAVVFRKFSNRGRLLPECQQWLYV